MVGRGRAFFKIKPSISSIGNWWVSRMKRSRCLKGKKEKDLCDKRKQLCIERASGPLIMGAVKPFKFVQTYLLSRPISKKKGWAVLCVQR
jgi:hypothetical protein